MAVTLGQQAADAERETETARQSLLESAGALDLAVDEEPDAAALDSAEARLEAARSALEARNAADTRIADASRRENGQEQRVESALREHQAAEAASQEARKEWRRWLDERGLDETLTPDTMTTFIARVETARSSLSEARRMRDRWRPSSTTSRSSASRWSRWRPATVCRWIPATSGNWPGWPMSLSYGWTKPRPLFPGGNRRERRLKSTVNCWRAGSGDYSRRERQRPRCLLRRARTTPRTFAAGRDSTRNGWSWSGSGTNIAATWSGSVAPASGSTTSARHWLRLTQTGWAKRSARLSEVHGEVDAKRNALREERGGIDTELAQLTGEEESSALRIRRSALEEQLREHAREWSRLTIAETLLEKTRQKFEQERQPSVIRHAQDFFSGVTGQRYQRLYAPIGEQTITVTDATGSGKQPAELSRGTREQLYLALRFGLIREFGEHAERLPVVVDEALVNFRPRTRPAGRRILLPTGGDQPGAGLHLPPLHRRNVRRRRRGAGGEHQRVTSLFL